MRVQLPADGSEVSMGAVQRALRMHGNGLCVEAVQVDVLQPVGAGSVHQAPLYDRVFPACRR